MRDLIKIYIFNKPYGQYYNGWDITRKYQLYQLIGTTLAIMLTNSECNLELIRLHEPNYTLVAHREANRIKVVQTFHNNILPCE